MERPPRAVVQAARSAQGWQTPAAKWTVAAPGTIGGGLLRGTRDARLGEVDRKRRLRKAAPIGTRPRFGANRDAARVQGANVGTAQVAAIDQQFGERSVLREVRRQQRQGLVLRFVGGSDNRADNHIGVHEFDDVAFVAGEEPRPRLASMAHLRIAQRRHALGGDAAPNAPLPGGRVGFQILRQDPPQRGERGLHGRRLGDRHLARHPLLQAVDLAQQPGERLGLRGGIAPVDIQRRLEAPGAQQRDAGVAEHLVARRSSASWRRRSRPSARRGRSDSRCLRRDRRR